MDSPTSWHYRFVLTFVFRHRSDVMSYSEAKDLPNVSLGIKKKRDIDGMVIVFVPAGSFEMGCTDAQMKETLRLCSIIQEDCKREWFEDETPAHTVSLDSFWIDQTEVMNKQYCQFLNAKGNQAENGIRWFEPSKYGLIEEVDGRFRSKKGYEQFPVIEISWYGAAAYCAWIGGRLPTEAEWEYVSRGPDGNLYPWGDTFDGRIVNSCDASCDVYPYSEYKNSSYNDGQAKWGPVGRYPSGASWCDALDLCGNVWEWVQDRYNADYYAHSPDKNPKGPSTGEYYVRRGGSWSNREWQLLLTSRRGEELSSRRIHWIGFRCVIPHKL